MKKKRYTEEQIGAIWSGMFELPGRYLQIHTGF